MDVYGTMPTRSLDDAVCYKHIPKLETHNRDLNQWPLKKRYLTSTTRMDYIIHNIFIIFFISLE